ncbi:MAG: sigma-54-dependent Fis family transcriptional regulator [Desulfobacterium sp.]|nr:sigma-54-dependent Fis family transcriptional regulator [Desulfobacterium sp.]
MTKKGKIFLLDDEELISEVLFKALRNEGYDVMKENETDHAIEKITAWDPDILLLDISMPGRSGMEILKDIMASDLNTQVVMLTADDSAESAVTAMKIGAVDYITKPFNTDEVKIILNNIFEKEALKKEVTFLRKAYSDTVEKEFIGESKAIKEIKATVEKMAQAKVSSILLTGESGTGKEVIARHIHQLMFSNETSRYAPFVSINCAAMPESLLESELFGHEKGAFTDAKTLKKGLFEEAKGGSILLDEISEMKLSLQSKLLRVLEERTLRRIGGKQEIQVNVTIIATSNINLIEAVGKGNFRQDLFFRLSPFYLHIPPLRERKGDIPLLVDYFLSYFISKYNKNTLKGFSPEAERLLMNYNWPGNVRELKNVLERFVVLESNEIIRPEHIPNWISGHDTIAYSPVGGRFILPESGISLDDVEKDLISQALEKSNRNMAQAAKLLNITYDSFRYQLKKFGLK